MSDKKEAIFAVCSCVLMYTAGFPRGVMVNIKDCHLKVSKFGILLCCYYHFWTNILPLVWLGFMAYQPSKII